MTGMFARVLGLGAILAGMALGERVSVPLSDPSRPPLIKVATVNGSIRVRTHERKDVVIVEVGDEAVRRSKDGMREIGGGRTGLVIEEEQNVVKVSASRTNEAISVWVPARASLNLRAVNGQGIEVEAVTGDIDVETVNGGAQIRDVSGSVVAHSVNGQLLVTLSQVTPGRPLSFSSLNGRLDVTLPAAVRAELKVHTFHGRITSDFEAVTNAERQSERRNDKRRVFTIQLNGGGSEIAFRSMNGPIFIRKGGN